MIKVHTKFLVVKKLDEREFKKEWRCRRGTETMRMRCRV